MVQRVLDHAGISYADEAGIRLKDTPMPLFQLLTLSMLASKPIDAAIAVLDAKRSDMINAFGRAHYVRYDESSATRLVDIATTVRDDYGGDLRRLAARSDRDVTSTARLLKQFKGIGDTGADIFLREVQDVWPWLRPYFDDRAIAAAKDLGLPADADKLSALAPRSNSRLAAALVRVSLDKGLREKLLQAK
jgi:hypothetical protein